MLRIMILLVVGSLAIPPLLFADGPVLKTGQTKSYDEIGNVVIDGSIKDDGYYRTGKIVSYTSGYDVVTDQATGLHWQDDESVTKSWVTRANYNAGMYFDTSGDTATTYCNELPLNGGGWRLPTVQELQTLVDYSQYDPSITPGLFNHSYEGYDTGYWSSTSSATTTYDYLARLVRFSDGSAGSDPKDFPNYVRCVKDGELQPPSLSRNSVTEIVTDLATELQWQDDSAVVSTSRIWTDAIDYCEELELGGDNDWRMPNVNELFSIVDYSRRPTIDTSVFVNTEISGTSGLWSSTTSAEETKRAWRLQLETGLMQDLGIKTFTLYVRCVRGGGDGIGQGCNGSDCPTLLTQTQVSQLYVSIFGRASEGEGNAYWQSEQSDMTVAANAMLNTEPAKAYFGDTLNNNQMFIEFIYENTLGKTYSEDPDGIFYWVSKLESGKTKGEVVATLIGAAQDPANAGAAQDRFNNKVEVCSYVAATIVSVPDVNDLSAFVNFISGVTDDPATVVDAKAAVDAF